MARLAKQENVKSPKRRARSVVPSFPWEAMFVKVLLTNMLSVIVLSSKSIELQTDFGRIELMHLTYETANFCRLAKICLGHTTVSNRSVVIPRLSLHMATFDKMCSTFRNSTETANLTRYEQR